MDGILRRLGIAMATAVVLLGLNAVAVVSGLAEQSYARLLGAEGVDHSKVSRATAPASVGAVQTGECAHPAPKPVSPEPLVLVAMPCRDARARVC
jgi:hypothetical protein